MLMELEVTWNRAIRVWWAYAWRNLIGVLISMIAGLIIGFMVGGIMRMMGFPPLATQIVIGILSGLCGLAISVVPMKLILGKEFRDFRLVLISKVPPSPIPAETEAL